MYLCLTWLWWSRLGSPLDLGLPVGRAWRLELRWREKDSWAVGDMWSRGEARRGAVMVHAVSPRAGLKDAVPGREGLWGQDTAPQHRTGRLHLPSAFRTLLGDKKETMKGER